MDEVDAATRSTVFNYGLQASTFSVDCVGQKAVLAVQKWLAVVSLDASDGTSEHKPLRKLGRANKYEIKGVLWNPHKAKRSLLASTYQQKLELWDVSAERYPLLHSIKAHTRPVSDMSWCFSDPGLMASCSTDSFIHVWDIREIKRPAISFKAVAGATLVQWNRLSGDLIASAHDSDIRIWDRRKPSTASGYITAHTSRIHNLDWSHASQSHLTTCSHDGSVKFWDTSSPREPIDVIKAAAHPLWRAKNYPTGDAIALLLVPTLHGGDTRVFLWGRTNLETPTHILSGHTDAVLEVQWIDGARLATWSRDRTLRMWTINEQLQFNLGGEIGGQEGTSEERNLPASPPLTIAPSIITSSITPTATPSNNSSHVGSDMSTLDGGSGERGRGSFGALETPLNPTMSLPLIKTHGGLSETTLTVGGGGSGLALSGSPSSHSLASMSSTSSLSSVNPVLHSIGGHSLAKEFSQFRTETVPNLEIERLDSANRSCTVKAWQGSQLVRVGITFPSHYPNGAAPSFMFHQSTTLSTSSQQELLRSLTDQATSLVKQNKPCLDACLQYLVKSLESLTTRPSPPKHGPDLEHYGRLDDKHIPFPRTSGARFSASGLLVCFNSPPGLVAGDNIKTPRSLNKMNTYTSRIHPVVMVPGSRWSAHAYHSTSMATRTSPGNTTSVMEGGVVRGSDQAANNPFTAPITVYNVTALLPIDMHLAKTYSLLGSSIEEICSQNAAAAAYHGRADLVKAWSTAALVAADIGLTPPPNPTVMPWPRHPFCRSLIKSLFSHFSHLHDVQMLAMLACVFQEHCNRTSLHLTTPLTTPQQQHEQQHKQHSPPTSHHNQSSKAPPPPTHPPGGFSFFSSSIRNGGGTSSSPPKKLSAHALPHQQQQQVEQDLYKGSVVSPISSSWHEVQIDGTVPPFSEAEDPVMEEQHFHENQCQLLDATMKLQCDEYRRSYSDILYSWSLLEQRAEILKYQINKPPLHECRSSKSSSVKVSRITCSICNLLVKGSSNLCLSCGHGGHTKHLMDWFSKYTHCPTGCGCSCLQASGWS